MNYKIIELENDLAIEVKYDVSKEQIGDGHMLPDIPKEVLHVKVTDLVTGSYEDLCLFIDSQNGNFYDLLEVKILKLEG